MRKGDNPVGVMWVTNLSDNSITMKNAAGIVELKPGQIIDIGEVNICELKLKVADSNTLRVHLYDYWLNEKSEHRGAAGSKNLAAWDGLNYAGFLYDTDSGNYSESLVITNLTGRRIPEDGLTYTSYRLRKVPYAVTNIKGIKSEGTMSEKKLLLEKPPWFEGVDEAGHTVPWEDDTLGIGRRIHPDGKVH